jgi:putative ABC transport system ATP-binding protein
LKTVKLQKLEPENMELTATFPKFILANLAEKASEPLIRIRNVVKTFKNAAGEVTVLKGINLDFHRGEFAGVIGKSGSGKSTLINMVTGIDHPTRGEVLINGVNVHRMNESKLSVWRGLNLGVVFQFFQLLPMLSLLENVMLPMDFCNRFSRAERPERAMNILRQLELEEFAHKLPSALSGGLQQRAAIARALANDPPILVADEPTGNLESRNASSIFDLFQGLAAQGMTVIIVTHDHTLSKRLSRTVLIADGEIVKS